MRIEQLTNALGAELTGVQLSDAIKKTKACSAKSAPRCSSTA